LKGTASKVGRWIAIFAAALAVATGATPPAARAADPRPNVLLILTDDQRFDSLWAMPNVQSDLVDKGVTFSNGFLTNSLCCPSRASILTGQYSHSDRVYTNRPHDPMGGFPAFDDSSTVATWLHDAGYATGLFGKYLNGYRGDTKTKYIPPGWDRWFVSWKESAYYNYDAIDQNVVRHYGHKPNDYGTTVTEQMADQFIRSTDPDTPVFVDFSTHAPHYPATPGPGDEHAFSDLPPLRPPNYDEAAIGDKPSYVRHLHHLSPSDRANLDARYVNQYRTLLSLDRAVGSLVQALDDTGRLSNTLIIYLTDNGYMFGEHRIQGKLVPYEESIRTPFLVRYDPLDTPGTTLPNLAVNIDVAPTIAQAAGVAAPGVDGRSLLPVLSNPDAQWRKDFLLEHYLPAWVPTYCGIRSTRYTYVQYRTGEEELYKLNTDPYELNNLAGHAAQAATIDAMRTRLRQLCDPPPPGLHPMAPGVAGPTQLRADRLGAISRSRGPSSRPAN
jgi:arylsulfatase A-like enzyme